MKSMTGLSVNMSNSVELTSCVPMTSRANSITAHCRPRHSPRYGHPVVARPVGGEDLALDAAVAEPAGHEDARRAGEPLVDVLRRERLAVDPADLRVHAVRPGGVLERLGDGQVGVGQLDVLADERDLERGLGRLDPLDQRAPAVEVGLRLGVAEAELADEQPPEPERLELERDLVDRLGRGRPG